MDGGTQMGEAPVYLIDTLSPLSQEPFWCPEPCSVAARKTMKTVAPVL